MSKAISTPCIGICSSSMGDDVCRGCHRFAHEVVSWNGYPQEQRALVFDRLDSLLIQILKNKVRLVDTPLLSRKLAGAGIAFREQSDPHCWVYALLKNTAGEGVEASFWGFYLLPAYAHMPLSQFYEQLDDELYRLSQAHYQRYLEPGIVAARKAKK
ncbi:MAG: DUF1289 domain-containing protein [Porticoccaceae bacterium]|nr:DUF1289 domain-containing protein [Porticoccaceae bacterium]